MPYYSPIKSKDGKYVLPKVGGGLHKTKNGKVVRFHSKAAAEAAARAIMANESKK